MPRVDNKHCVVCGEPTSGEYCVECERDEYAAWYRAKLLGHEDY